MGTSMAEPMPQPFEGKVPCGHKTLIVDLWLLLSLSLSKKKKRKEKNPQTETLTLAVSSPSNSAAVELASSSRLLH